MIAYKPYSMSPEDQRDPGTPLTYPWVSQELIDDSVELRASLISDGFILMESADYTLFLAEQDLLLIPKAIEYPTISARQIRLALLQAGVTLDQVELAIDNIPEPAQSMVRVSWEYSIEYHRNNENILGLGAALGLTSEQIDGLWALAVEL